MYAGGSTGDQEGAPYTRQNYGTGRDRESKG